MDQLIVSNPAYYKKNHPALTLTNPTKPITTFFTLEKIIIYDDQQEKVLHSISLNDRSSHHKYSPDGNFLAFIFYDNADNNGEIQHCIFDIRSGKQTKLPTFDGDTFITSTCFHPTHHVLATLTYPENVIRYWDLEKQRWFGQHETLNIIHCDDKANEWLAGYVKHNNVLFDQVHHKLSFTPSGTFITLSWHDNKIELPVPFETIGKSVYALGMKNKLFSLFCLLKQYRHGHKPLLPEVISLLIQNMLKISEL